MSRNARPVQYFSDAYLERCRTLTPAQIARFLDDFRRLYGAEVAARPPPRTGRGAEPTGK